jgi:hypothetical protein
MSDISTYVLTVFAREPLREERFGVEAGFCSFSPDSSSEGSSSFSTGAGT